METLKSESTCVVAIVDCGVSPDELAHSPIHPIRGWSLSFRANNHVQISRDFNDVSAGKRGSRLTELVLDALPGAQILAVRVFQDSSRSDEQQERVESPMAETAQMLTSELIAAGIETAAHAGAHIVLVPTGTANMGKALLLKEACDAARSAGSLVVSVASADGTRSYPADVPQVISVTAHRACRSNVLRLSSRRFPRREWRSLSGTWISDGHDLHGEYWGAEAAAARVAGQLAGLQQQLGSVGDGTAAVLYRAFEQATAHCIFELDFVSQTEVTEISAVMTEA